MTKAGEGYRIQLGYIALISVTVLPLLSFLLLHFRRSRHPIKRSGRPKLAYLLMYAALLCTIPTCLQEIYGMDYVSCMLYKFSTIFFPPLFISPVLASKIQHFRECRIHAKMAGHAKEHNIQRNKQVFENLVGDLLSVRNHLRRNTVIFYVLILLVYISTGGLFIVQNNSSFKDLGAKYKEDECAVTDVIYIINCIYGLISAVVLSLFVYYSREQNLQDDYGLDKEYSGVVIIFVFTIPIYSCLRFIPDPALHLENFDPVFTIIGCMVLTYCLLVLWPALRTFKMCVPKQNYRGLKSQQLRNSNIGELTSLQEVLTSNLYYLFVEHLKGEFSVENVLFWKDVETMKVEFGGGSTLEGEDLEDGKGNKTPGGRPSRSNSIGNSARSFVRSFSVSSMNNTTIPIGVALDIYLMFVKTGSLMEVNISSSIREKIAKELMVNQPRSRNTNTSPIGLSSNNPANKNDDRPVSGSVALGTVPDTVSIDIFDEAQQEIYRLMESDSLKRFKEGKLFQTYLGAIDVENSFTSKNKMLHGGTTGGTAFSGKRSPNGSTTPTPEDPNNHGIELAMHSQSNKSVRNVGGASGPARANKKDADSKRNML